MFLFSEPFCSVSRNNYQFRNPFKTRVLCLGDGPGAVLPAPLVQLSTCLIHLCQAGFIFPIPLGAAPKQEVFTNLVFKRAGFAQRTLATQRGCKPVWYLHRQ